MEGRPAFRVNGPHKTASAKAMGKKGNRYRSGKGNRQGTFRNWLKTTFGFFSLVFGIVLLSGALAHSYYALLEASWLRVEEIRVTGLKHLEREQVLNTLGVPRYANTLTLKMAQLAPRVQALPWVKSAVVRLDLPGRLVVEITEREVMAVVSAENYYLMDRDGKLFARTTREQSPDHLMVSGFSGKGLQEGSMLPSEPFEALKKLLKALEKAKGWLPLSQIAECRWQGDEGFILVAAQKNVPIRLGTDDLDQKLERLHRIFQMLGDRQWLDMVTGIDLDYTHRAFVQGHFPHPKPPKAS